MQLFCCIFPGKVGFALIGGAVNKGRQLLKGVELADRAVILVKFQHRLPAVDVPRIIRHECLTGHSGVRAAVHRGALADAGCRRPPLPVQKDAGQIDARAGLQRRSRVILVQRRRTQQAAADAKSEADAKKEAADEAQDKLSQGAVAYFGDKGASQAVKVLTDPTVTEYLDAIHNGAKGDATTLDNMIEALKFIQEANQLRAKEGLQPLKVSDTLMAQAMADADYANNNVNHPLQFPASENLAWGYTAPFNGWYDTEKSMYEKDMSDGVLDCKTSDGKPVKPCAYGHYTTLVNTDFTLTGFGVSQNGNITGIGGNTHSQLFTENANGIGSDAGRIMDVDAYLADLTAYRDSLTGADAAYQTALSKSKQAAQDASDAAKALAANYVFEAVKTIRGYGGGVLVATQDLNDFFSLEDGKYGRGILNNCKIKIILNLEEEEAQRVQSVLKLTDAEIDNITRFERGSALIVTNSNNVTVDMRCSEEEKDLITTDRDELRRIVERKMQNQTETEES